jgi:hypothetical protein
MEVVKSGTAQPNIYVCVCVCDKCAWVTADRLLTWEVRYIPLKRESEHAKRCRGYQESMIREISKWEVNLNAYLQLTIHHLYCDVQIGYHNICKDQPKCHALRNLEWEVGGGGNVS